MDTGIQPKELGLPSQVSRTHAGKKQARDRLTVRGRFRQVSDFHLRGGFRNRGFRNGGSVRRYIRSDESYSKGDKDREHKCILNGTRSVFAFENPIEHCWSTPRLLIVGVESAGVLATRLGLKTQWVVCPKRHLDASARTLQRVFHCSSATQGGKDVGIFNCPPIANIPNIQPCSVRKFHLVDGLGGFVNNGGKLIIQCNIGNQDLFYLCQISELKTLRFGERLNPRRSDSERVSR